MNECRAEISKATVRIYERRMQTIMRQIEQKNRVVTPASLADIMKENVGHLAKSSWRQYRAAVIWWIEGNRSEGFKTAFDAMMDGVSSPEPRRTKLVRSVAPNVLQLVTDNLRERGVFGQHLSDLILATVYTGLRPSEWSNARLEHDRLIVTNAKFREGERGNGQVRELIIARDMLGSVQYQAVAKTIEWMSSRVWNDVQPNASVALKDVVRKLVSDGEISRRWLKLRIYDCRHQFATDAKANLSLLDGEVAAAMGHRSALTSVLHYGRKNTAKGRTMVRPTAVSVAKVSDKSIERLRGELAHNHAFKQKLSAGIPNQSVDNKNSQKPDNAAHIDDAGHGINGPSL